MRESLSRQAFTLVEILVVVGISLILSSLAINYSSQNRNQIALTVEESKIAQFILQARQLAIATYAAAGSGACGYGVVFNTAANPQTYSIFAYTPNGTRGCPTVASTTDALANGLGSGTSQAEQQYTAGTWAVPVTKGVTLNSAPGDSLAAVIFYPPDPTTFLSHDGNTFSTLINTQKIYLSTADGNNTAVLSVNPEGQVNF